jgi:release factor glutamine methyltransferase
MTGWTAGKLYARGREMLQAKSIDEAEQNSEWLLSHVCGMGRMELRAFADTAVSDEKAGHFFTLISMKVRGWPLAYLTGEQPFMDMSLRVNPAVLVPRPETEGLVRLALDTLEKQDKKSPRLLDIGTGSGCIACALAKHLPASKVVAVEASRPALETAQLNAGLLGLDDRISFVQGSCFENIEGTFDAIVTNPPYIPTGMIEALDSEVRCEPLIALDGGADGMDCVNTITSRAHKFLSADGFIAFEIGYNQSNDVRALLEKTGAYKSVRTVADDFGHNRYVLGEK